MRIMYLVIVYAERVIRSLNDIIEWRGKPKTISVDNDEGEYGPSGAV